MVIGADRCKAGWFIVQLADDGSWSIDLVFTTDELWRKYRHASLILLDVPIGLRETGTVERLCDLAARRALGPRASSVFPAPCRQALMSESYEEGSRTNWQISGRRLSKQSWAITPVIREVDELLFTIPAARSVIREMHPELCFWGLGGMRPMAHPKKTEQGYQERLTVLQDHYPAAESIIMQALNNYPKRLVSRDDIVDALVGAITAGGGAGALATLPEIPEIDPRGLPMEMIYQLT